MVILFVPFVFVAIFAFIVSLHEAFPVWFLTYNISFYFCFFDNNSIFVMANKTYIYRFLEQNQIKYKNMRLMCFSCHIRHLMKCPNWCRTWNICFLLIFSWKMLQPKFAIWDTISTLRQASNMTWKAHKW